MRFNKITNKNEREYEEIGLAGRDRFILECDNYEIGRIMAAYSGNEYKIEVGTEIPVSELYQAACTIISEHKELTDHSEKVLKLMTAMQKFGAVVGPIAARLNEKMAKK